MKDIHIAAGLLALCAGAVAMLAAKGGPRHRAAGRVFAAAMLLMTGTALVAALRYRQAVNIVAAGLTLYLVATGVLTAVRSRWSNRLLDTLLLVWALVVGTLGMAYGLPADAPYRAAVLVFGALALVAAAGDGRMLVRGTEGRMRTARHLWRMTTAMWIAVLSFFIGQARFLPDAVRQPLLLAIPVAAVGLAMFYWLWRVLGARARFP
ncbi:MAG: hypothetical protein HY854_25085 [Burkholderiales bacterium]|nr:hypothetical protein [Burkholderiales bacterium]